MAGIPWPASHRNYHINELRPFIKQRGVGGLGMACCREARVNEWGVTTRIRRGKHRERSNSHVTNRTGCASWCVFVCVCVCGDPQQSVMRKPPQPTPPPPPFFSLFVFNWTASNSILSTYSSETQKRISLKHF